MHAHHWENEPELQVKEAVPPKCTIKKKIQKISFSASTELLVTSNITLTLFTAVSALLK